MKQKPDEIKRRMERLTAGLTQGGVKLTHQRMEVCREIASAVDHPDAESVFRGVRKRVPTISLDTVYRTLWKLRDMGLIETLGVPHERTRFDPNTDHHHHFICLKCAKAYDFYSSALDALSAPDEVGAFGTVRTMQVEVRGICWSCSTEQDSILRSKPD